MVKWLKVDLNGTHTWVISIFYKPTTSGTTWLFKISVLKFIKQLNIHCLDVAPILRRSLNVSVILYFLQWVLMPQSFASSIFQALLAEAAYCLLSMFGNNDKIKRKVRINSRNLDWQREVRNRFMNAEKLFNWCKNNLTPSRSS